MFEDNNDLIDRLRNRELIDRWAFLAFAFGGSILIWLAKAASLNAILVALGAMLVMLSYAALVNLGSKLKLRADQLGDNCYYLGLVFTLASLSYAIFTFDPANTATTIVQGFGVALVSTVLGLILRVFFTQGQPDMAAAEENARIALTETAAQVRADLDGVLLAFQSFSVQTKQHLLELREQVQSDIGEASFTAKASIADAAEEAKAAVTETTNEAVGEVKRVSSATNRLVKAIENHAVVLAEVAATTATQLENLKAVELASEAASRALTDVASAAELVKGSQETVNQNSTMLAASGNSIAETLAAVHQATKGIEGVVEARLKLLSDASLTANQRVDAALAEAIQRWQATIDQHAASQKAFLLSLEQERTQELQNLRRHNDALQAEVEKSKDKVGLVQSALVDMTRQLTSQVSNGS